MLLLGDLTPWFLRKWILMLMGMRIGRSSFVDHDIYVKFPWKVRIGFNTTINRGVQFYPGIQSPSKIIIGNHCAIAPNVRFYAAGHDADSIDYSDTGGDIVVGDHVWIGADAIVLQGVCIGEGSVVGAGSLVTRDIPSNVIVAGSPARKLRDKGSR
jgi:maltose O-acetyltransferase